MARAKLGEILMQRGLIDAATLKRALGEQLRFVGQKIKIGQLLVDMRVCTWEQVCQALAEQLGFPYADFANADDASVKLVPLDVCEKWNAVAFHRELGPPEQVCVAFDDPTDLVAIDAIRLRVGKRVKVFISAPDKRKAVLDRVFRGIEAGDGGGLALENELFGGDDAPMAVEHYEQGSLAMDAFAASQMVAQESQVEPAPAPQMAAPSAASMATSDALDSLLGGPADATPTPVRVPAAPPPQIAAAESASAAAGLGDPFAGLGMDVPPAPPRNTAPPTANTARVEVTHFPDKRVKEPAPPPPKPTLVLTSDALFGSAPPPPPPDDAVAEDVSMEVLSAEPIEDAGPGHELFAASLEALGQTEPAPESEQPVIEASVDLTGEMVSVEEADPTAIADDANAASVAAEPVAESKPAEAPVAVEARPPSKPAVAPATPEPVAPAASPQDEARPASTPASAEPPPGAAAAAAAEPVQNEESLASFADRPLTAEELEIIGAIEQLADGDIEASPVKQTKPAHMIAALVRLLIRRGLIQETEFLDELSRK